MEGKMSQANFMRNLRMTFPQYVTNVSSFDDSIKILKNKGILNEITFSGSGTPDEDRPMRAAMPNMDRVKKRAEDPEYDFDKEEPNEDAEFDAILKQLEDEKTGEEAVVAQYDVNEEEINEAKKVKGDDGKKEYAKFKEIDDANGEEVFKGINMEHECSPNKTKEEIEKIVLKNIKKNANYYTNFLLTGIRDYHLETMDKSKPEDHQMKPVTPGNLVDTKRGMTKVKVQKKIVKENLDEVDLKIPAVNTPDEKNLQKLLPTYTTLVNALKRENTIAELDGLFEIFLNATTLTNMSKSAMIGALRSVLDRTPGSTFTSKLVDQVAAPVTPNTASSKVSSGIFGGPNTGGIARGIKEADVPQDDKVEAELASALSQQPTLKRILQKVDLPQEVNGTIKALLDRTNLKNVPDAIILAALRKVLNDQPGPSFTAQHAINKNIGKPLPDLKEKLTALVREILAEKEEAPSKKTASEEITAKMCAFIEDYNEGEKTYKKSQLENVFDSYEDKVGHRFDDSVFENVIDMLKAKGYTMAVKEMFDGRDNMTDVTGENN
jgi:hypothetical protein